jgi:hypothetical protein
MNTQTLSGAETPTLPKESAVAVSCIGFPKILRDLTV